MLSAWHLRDSAHPFSPGKLLESGPEETLSILNGYLQRRHSPSTSSLCASPGLLHCYKKNMMIQQCLVTQIVPSILVSRCLPGAVLWPAAGDKQSSRCSLQLGKKHASKLKFPNSFWSSTAQEFTCIRGLISFRHSSSSCICSRQQASEILHEFICIMKKIKFLVTKLEVQFWKRKVIVKRAILEPPSYSNCFPCSPWVSANQIRVAEGEASS